MWEGSSCQSGCFSGMMREVKGAVIEVIDDVIYDCGRKQMCVYGYCVGLSSYCGGCMCVYTYSPQTWTMRVLRCSFCVWGDPYQ